MLLSTQKVTIWSFYRSSKIMGLRIIYCKKFLNLTLDLPQVTAFSITILLKHKSLPSPCNMVSHLILLYGCNSSMD